MIKNQDKRYPLNSEIIEGISDVPEVDLSMIDNAQELCISRIKDFIKYPKVGEKYARNNNFMIIFSDGTYIATSCSRTLLNFFINHIMDK